MKELHLPQNTEFEGKLKRSEIILHFFRHSKAEAKTENTEDKARHLTEAGASIALDKKKSDVKLEQSVAYGSPRVRSQETAAYVMAGEEIDPQTPPKEVLQLIDGDLNFGSKTGVLKELDFNTGDKNMADLANKALSEGAYLDFIFNKSDDFVVELGDKQFSSYTRQAANVAKIIEKYLRASKRWNDLVNNPSAKYTPTLERFLGSHQGVLESFLGKILELKYGLERKKEFQETLSSNGGFDFVEGFTVKLECDDSQQEIKIRVLFTKKGTDEKPDYIIDEIIDQNTINAILRDLDLFETKVSKNAK